jgi:hypothetical protein
MKWKNALWLLAALPVFGLPLLAGESRPEPAVPAQPAGNASDAPPPADAPEPAATEAQEPADERISADTSLTYPVDI